MSLSFTEKRDLQKAIKTNLEQLRAGNLSFSEKSVSHCAHPRRKPILMRWCHAI